MTSNKRGNLGCHTKLQKGTKMTNLDRTSHKIENEVPTNFYYQICEITCMQLFYNQIFILLY